MFPATIVSFLGIHAEKRCNGRKSGEHPNVAKRANPGHDQHETTVLSFEKTQTGSVAVCELIRLIQSYPARLSSNQAE